ncbi:MAG: T9SS type A sorting domain-containing protein, partial [Flavobacterium sp.]|nr:T9SS type A sorting domain-containing protein [Flavobacterium sp.]
IDMKTQFDVFENGQHAWNFSQTGRARLDIWTSTTQTADLSYVFVLTNMTNSVSNAAGGFPFTGTWYNLMDGSSFEVTSTTMPVSIEADGFRIFGNKNPQLSIPSNGLPTIAMYPNPAAEYFTINTSVEKVEIFTLTGQRVKIFGQRSAADQCDVSELNTGVYIVKVIDQQHRQTAMKLIKR